MFQMNQETRMRINPSLMMHLIITTMSNVNWDLKNQTAKNPNVVGD
jgi:hypothetical protein